MLQLISRYIALHVQKFSKDQQVLFLPDIEKPCEKNMQTKKKDNINLPEEVIWDILETICRNVIQLFI